MVWGWRGGVAGGGGAVSGGGAGVGRCGCGGRWELAYNRKIFHIITHIYRFGQLKIH